MQGLIAIIYVFVQAFSPSFNNEALGYEQGMMPETVVTASRYEPLSPEQGMMPETVVTAPRYEPLNPDQGMMPETVVIAPRYQPLSPDQGMMPETVVIAPRHKNEDVAYSGMMPEVFVVADRYVEQTRHADSPMDEKLIYVLTLDLGPKFAYAQPINDVDVITTDLTFGGDYNLAQGDTIEEDVTVTGGNATIDGVIDGDLAVMGGAVAVSGMIDGDVAVFGGNLDILGTITGDAAVFGGLIHNQGTIQGEIFVVGGTVTLDSGSVVEGDINMVGGSVDRDTNAVILGNIESIEMEALERLLPRIGRIGRAFKWTKEFPGSGALSGIIGITVLFVIYMLNLLVLMIFPQSMDKVREKIQLNVWASVGFGIGIQVLFIPLIIVFAVSVIGIPLIFLLLLAIPIALLFGVSAISAIIGERINKGFNWHVQSRFGFFSLGWLTIMLLLILGFILRMVGLIIPPVFAFGGIILYVAATIGLGGVIYALVKRERKTDKKG